MQWVWTIVIHGLLAWGAHIGARDVLSLGKGFDRLLGATVLAWAWAILGMEFLGTIGAIDRPALLAWAILGVVVGVWFGRGKPPVQSASHLPKQRWEWEATLAVGFTLWTAGELFGVSLLGPVKVVSDGPIYHLYFAAKWWKSGMIFLVPTPFGENAAPYFPATGDLWFTWLFTCWGGDRLAKVGQAPFLALAWAAVCAIARKLGANRSAAAIAGVWAISSSPLLLYTFEANVDTIVVALLIVSAYFFMVGLTSDERLAPIGLGAIAAGAAWGAKPTGIVFVPPLLAIVAAMILVRRDRDWKTKARMLITIVLGTMLTEGFWLARNLLMTGNPLYPLQIQLFGVRLLSGWYGPEAMKWSGYYIPRDDWRSLLGLFFQVFDPRLSPIWLAAILGAWRIGRSGNSANGVVWTFAFAAIVTLILYWVVIPYRTQQRFMLPAVAFAAVPLAILLDRSRVPRIIASVLVGIHLLTPQSWTMGLFDAASLQKISPRIPGLPGLLQLPRGDDPLFWFVWGILGLSALASAWFWGIVFTQSGERKRELLRAVCMSGLFLGGECAWADSGKLGACDRFFPNFPDYQAAWAALDRANAGRSARIAYAGTNLPYYLLGRDFRNEVVYVNINDHPGWRLHDYRRAASARGPADWPNPRPGWDRLEADFDAWLKNLRGAGIDDLVVARANPNEGTHLRNPRDPLGFPIERAWAESRPDLFAPLYGVHNNDPRMRIFRLRAQTDRASNPHSY